MTGSFTHRQHYYIFLSTDSFVRSKEYDALAEGLKKLKESYEKNKDIFFYQQFNIKTIEYLLSYLAKNMDNDSQSAYINQIEYDCLRMTAKFITNDNMRVLWTKILSDCMIELHQNEVLSNAG